MPHPTKKLGEVCEILTGSTPRTSVSDYYGGDILWAGPTDLDQGVYVTNTQKKLTKKGVEEGGARLIPKNSIMVSCIGYIGKVAIASADMATNQQINTFYPKIKGLDSKYLYYALIFKADEFKKASSQTTLPIINKTKCSNIEISLPPLAEQRKIVARLERLLGKIKEAKRLRAEAQEAAQNLLPAELHRIFTQQHSNILQNVGMSGKPASVKNYGEAQWEEKELEEVLEYEQPTKYIVKSTDYSDEYKNPVLTAGKSFIKGYTNENDNIFPAKKLPVIIFDDFTTATKFVDFPFKVKSSAMKILHAKKEKADIKFLFYIMQTVKLNHDTHKRYWISEYSKTKIPLPPVAEQKKIVARLDSLSEKIKKLREYQKSTASNFTFLEQSILSQSFQ